MTAKKRTKRPLATRKPRASSVSAQSFRERLIGGFIGAITKSGYARTSIADIVREAKVSKRTFYEEFKDKEECFLAVYAHETQRLLADMVTASLQPARPLDRIDAALGVYFAELAKNPALTRTCLLEIQAAGPRGLTMRRQVMGDFAEALVAFVEAARQEEDGIRALSPQMAFAVVGGINELVLLGVERNHAIEVATVKTASALLRAVLRP